MEHKELYERIQKSIRINTHLDKIDIHAKKAEELILQYYKDYVYVKFTGFLIKGDFKSLVFKDWGNNPNTQDYLLNYGKYQDVIGYNLIHHFKAKYPFLTNPDNYTHIDVKKLNSVIKSVEEMIKNDFGYFIIS